MTLIASIITFSKKKLEKNVTLDPRHGTLALDMEPSTLDPRQKDRLPGKCIIKKGEKKSICYIAFPKSLFLALPPWRSPEG